MRQPVARRYFVEDGKVVHAKAAWGEEKGLEEISEAMARELSAKAREGVVVPMIRPASPEGSSMPTADLSGMHARLTDFEARVADTVHQVAEAMHKESQSDKARIAELEQQVSDILSEFRKMERGGQ